MNDLLCPHCGREARTGPIYPLRCICGELWCAGHPELYPVSGGGEEGVQCPTPLWEDPEDADLWWKREDLNRTGSFKDRGARVLAGVALQAGAETLVLDSSGSAALAGAAAAAEVGLPITVHCPEDLPPPKREALTALGARIVAEGNRSAAADRARRSAAREFYFSHVYHPAFREGTGMAAVEVLHQCADKPPPVWVVPVGNGSLFLGLYLALARSKRTDIRLVAVQASACAGLRRPGTIGRTAAFGIGVGTPPRREEILAALADQDRDLVEVDEASIEAARSILGRRGVGAERASAAALAAIRRMRQNGETAPILGWLTGSGNRGG